MPEIQITGVHYDVSDKVKRHIEEKIGGLKRFCQELTMVHVIIHHGDKFGYRVDVEMHTGQGKDIIAHDKEETVYSAIDIVTDKCARQLRRLHSKQADHRQRSDKMAAMMPD